MCVKTATEKQTEKQKKEFNLERAIVLWIYKGNKGKYLSGRTEEGKKVVGFFTKEKQNPKEPDIKIYNQVEKGEKLGDPILSLWVKASDKGNKYISGKFDEKWIIGFFNSNAEVNGVKPYINIYFQEDKPEDQEKPEAKEEPKFEEIPSDNDLPF